MSLGTLSWSLVFVGVALLLSLWLKLGIDRDILVAAGRAAVQLLAIGFVLKTVFSLRSPVFTELMILAMILIATQNAMKRGRGFRRVGWRILLAIGVTEVISQGVLVGLGIVPFAPQYVIPISGMVIGQAMVSSGLMLNRLRAEAENSRQEITTILMLGGSPKQAMMPRVKAAIKASMIPTVDSTKTVGLVQLPGMMTGQILAGASPFEAVRYQVMIMFLFLGAVAIASIILAFVTYPTLFNQFEQLEVPV